MLYDLLSWQGLAQALADARVSGMSAAELEHFRDLVMRYSRSAGTDMSAQKEIEGITATFPQKAPDSVETKAATESSVAAQTEAVEPRTIPDVPVVTQQSDAVADAVLAEALRTQPTANAEQESVQEAVEQPEKTAVTADRAPTPEPVHTEHGIEESEQPEEVWTLDRARERIAALKHDIHERIGNPAAIIGGYGEYGRAYMQALLTATKATLGGAGMPLAPAMRAFEKATEQLLFAVESGAPVPAAVTAEAPTPSTPTESVGGAGSDEAPRVEPAIEPTIGTIAKPEPVPETLVQTKEAAPTQPATSAEAVVTGAPLVPPHKVELATLQAKVVELEQKLAHTTETQAAEVAERERVHRAEEEQLSEARTEAEALMQRETAYADSLRTELERREAERAELERQRGIEETKREQAYYAEMERLRREAAQAAEAAERAAHTVQELRNAKGQQPSMQSTTSHTSAHPRIPLDISVPTAMELESDLQTPEVTSGLQDLLNTWDIFRPGFFRREGGIDHPLYGKLRDVVMSDVLAGRFDGANTNVVISINDYVNAWRHEQGIEYVPMETFEHYLRRVIARVLKRTHTV